MIAIILAGGIYLYDLHQQTELKVTEIITIHK